ncbi:hypothetical protein [Tautonia marina]|uniref:hypothetical protein n=1 Tax=Tautonia marina TaxID=2653855 RepID=UPI001260E368|nr:hypothetical protein [Tautonia marina]
MTTRSLMQGIAGLAIGFWLLIALFRTVPVSRHLRPDSAIPGAFVRDWSYCDRRPFVSKFLRIVSGRAWPGEFTCPDHPDDPYVIDPDL